MADNFLLKAGACISLALLTSSQNLLITWSKRSGGGYNYNYVTVTLMAEVVKFLISGFFLFTRDLKAQAERVAKNGSDVEKGKGGADDDGAAGAPTMIDLRHELSLAGVRDRLGFALPALIYFVKNNLVFAGLKLLDPVTFQLLGNLKILTTTILFRFVMGKPLGDLTWIALTLLMIGMTYTQLKGDATLSFNVAGVTIMILIALSSGAAAVVTEYLMKSNPVRQKESINLQNMWLYFWGALFNFIAILYTDWNTLTTNGFFYGYSWLTCVILLNNSCSGLAVAVIMKYANNLVKLFVFCTSLVLTTALSVVFFGFELTPQFVLGTSVVVIAIYLYQRK